MTEKQGTILILLFFSICFGSMAVLMAGTPLFWPLVFSHIVLPFMALIYAVWSLIGRAAQWFFDVLLGPA